MVRKVLLPAVLAILVLSACKSTADEPKQDFNLLNLLGTNSLKSVLWTGPVTLSQCENTGADLTGCADLESSKVELPANNLTLFFSDAGTLAGTLTIITIHPDLMVPTTFPFSVQGTVRPGNTAGGTVGQFLELTASGTNPVTVSGVQARFDNFQTDITDSGLNGTMKLTLPGTRPVSVVYALVLKSAQ